MLDTTLMAEYALKRALQKIAAERGVSVNQVAQEHARGGLDWSVLRQVSERYSERQLNEKGAA